MRHSETLPAVSLSVLVLGLTAPIALAAPPLYPSPLRPAGSGPVMPLVFDSGAYNALKTAGAAAIPDFVLPDGAIVTLEVAPVEIFTPDATLVLMTAQGPLPLQRPDHLLLSGHISGQPDSSVFLGLSPRAVNGYLLSGGSTYVISSGPDRAAPAPVIYDPRSLPHGTINLNDVTCGTDRLPLPPHARRPRTSAPDSPSPRGVPCREAVLAIDSDWEYTSFTFGGDTTAAAEYAATLIAGVSEIYHNDINASLKIGYLRIWATSADPWTAGDVYNRIFEFQDHWNASMTGIQRHAAHLFSGIHSGGTGGVAYLPGLCQEEYDYGVSGYIDGFFPYPLQDNHPQNWDLMVTAHELGHNFGAPHTHNANPPVDGCGSGNCSQAAQGTIMSYCHTCSGGMTNIALTLHTRIINEHILPYLDEAPCNLEKTPVTITDQPDHVTVFAGENASMSLSATGSAFTIQWFKDNAPIPGATGTSISWTPATVDDIGWYHAEITNACGTVTSDTVMLMVNYCPSDYNEDGFVDGIDYDQFNNDFEVGSMLADYNEDGFVDGIDYDQFNNDFESGC